MSEKKATKKTPKEIYDEFVKTLEGLDEAQLRELEQKVIADAEAFEKSLATKMFKLPKKGYEEVATAIQMLLNKQTVQFAYTKGLQVMYEAWDPKNYSSEVNYPTLDSTLRTINQLQFTGYNEWKAATTINDYFTPIQEEYIDLTTTIYLHAEKHNAVMDKLKLFDSTIPNLTVGEDGGARLEE